MFKCLIGSRWDSWLRIMKDYCLLLITSIGLPMKNDIKEHNAFIFDLFVAELLLTKLKNYIFKIILKCN